MNHIKQYYNAIFMYLYLRYYQYKIATDSQYMIKQAIEHGVLMAPIAKEKSND